MSRTGATAQTTAARFGARFATTDFEAVLADPEVDAVLIATRHNLHAALALAALKAGKHVFLEKPLAITPADLDAIEEFFARAGPAPMLLTGFNRRFSPAARVARALLEQRKTPMVASYRMNAGYLPQTHWVHGEEGGGRNIGEACHIYDLFGYLTGSRPMAVQADAISPRAHDLRRDDNFVATVRYEDGSLCTLTYTALGAPGYPKERLDIFADGEVLSLDDYRRLDVAGGDRKGWSGETPDKGHLAGLEAFAAGIRSGVWPVSLEAQIAATRVSFLVEDQLRMGAGQ
jgi:predicted dehydrogenase